MQALFLLLRLMFLLAGAVIFIAGVWALLGAWDSLESGSGTVEYLLLGLGGLLGGLLFGYFGSRLVKRWSTQ